MQWIYFLYKMVFMFYFIFGIQIKCPAIYAVVIGYSRVEYVTKVGNSKIWSSSGFNT